MVARRGSAPAAPGAGQGAEGSCEVAFSLLAEIAPGSQVLVVGSPAELGRWEPGAGLRLVTSPGAYPRWAASKAFSLEQADASSAGCVEYKFVVLEPDVGAIWEGGPARRLALRAGSEGAMPAEPTTPRFGDRSHLSPSLEKQNSDGDLTNAGSDGRSDITSSPDPPAEHAPAGGGEQPQQQLRPEPSAGCGGAGTSAVAKLGAAAGAKPLQRSSSAPQLASLSEAPRGAAGAAAGAAGGARERALLEVSLRLPAGAMPGERAAAMRAEVVFEPGGTRKALAWQPARGCWTVGFGEVGLSPGLHQFHFLLEGGLRRLSEDHAVFGESNFAILSAPVLRCVAGHLDALEPDLNCAGAMWARASSTVETPSTMKRGLPRSSSISGKLSSLAEDSAEGSDQDGAVDRCAFRQERSSPPFPEEVYQGLCGAELKLHLHGMELPRADSAVGATRRPVRFWAGRSLLAKEGPGKCEDACFWGGRALGVSDGVGSMAQFASHGVDAAEYAAQLMQIASCALQPGGVASGASTPDPVTRAYRALEMAENGVQAFGAATITVLALNGAIRTVGVANLGDSGFMVLRRGPHGMTVFQKSAEQHHGWNCPYQLTRLPPALARFLLREDHCTDCDTYACEVQEGDLLIAYSDGVRDNLHDDEILGIVDRAVSPALADLAGLPQHATPPEKVAESLALAAKLRSMDPTARVPFNAYSRKHGLDRVGGKEDDITVVAAWVLPESGSTIPSAVVQDSRLDPPDALRASGAGIPE